ncbi:MAG: ABC-F family ATP-binding cassette domain-containing protein [Bacteroidetes bacterium]|nr:ABC-F family ATP-binding cassette domain-containing protein [Bacteroidota bacterium]MBU1484288.1 ABC-F family ATP-binding cassette domain-containing protein [Bacteroidota bacterium]MBU2045795.1 ABC-F family ATP-binding cassette domain-containing protein [Bacteroidota bacterium]MBU2267559.1 ABC-F family ATP-binding cassette domain-containing protein [Bacteroidota bacterium]MBU2377048.1 ABC-F family ATP-binding cassette domain-containing protein [Bacteroidota bacterium]
MSIVSAEQLGHAFNDYWLFKNLTFGIQQGQRVALVGINGAGKSTLLKLLAEKITPTEGKVVKAKDIRFGYLEQDPQFQSGQSISDFIFSLDNRQQQIIREYEELLENENPDVDEINRLTEELSNLEAWEYEHQIKTILGRLDIHHLDQKIDTLSGGQKKRLSLAKLLIDDPDVYVIDEPTNHLDIDTIEWLESFLTSGGKTILMVTHDRYFLDNVCNEIIELENGNVYTYKGKYAYYLEKKAEQDAINSTVLAKNKNLLKKELEWMRRMPQARGTKSKARIDSFYDLENNTKGQFTKETVLLDVKVSRQGKQILEIEHISKIFQGKEILENFSYVFKKGDKIGLTGKNGTGKSTLLNIITNELKPDSGRVKKGETTVFGYYHQSGLSFDESERVIDVIKNIAEFIVMSDGKTISASQLLTHFLFPPKKQHGFVSLLSGGEKKRLHLMKVLIKNPNFLILDEPTNDLDIDTLNVLEEFLENYPGVLVLVSHDRYLVDKLTEQLFVLEGNGQIRIYNGNYSSYRIEQEQLKTQQKEAKTSPIIEIKKESTKPKLSYKEQRELKTLEEEIEVVEKQIEDLTNKLNNPKANHEDLSSLAQEIEERNKSLEAKSFRWIELSELI